MSLTFVSCSKDEKEEPQKEDQTAKNDVVVIDGSDATLVAIISESETATPVGPMAVRIGTAVAVFYDNTPSTFLDAGTVRTEGNDLTKQSNNSYVFTPGITNPTGLEFDGSPEWDVSGGSGFSAINHTTTITFPGIGNISSGGTVTRADGYTLTLTTISNADSALFHVGGVSKMLPGGTTSYTFSAEELAGLSTGTNVVQVAAVNYENQNIDGKSVWFVNEKVTSKTITIQ